MVEAGDSGRRRIQTALPGRDVRAAPSARAEGAPDRPADPRLADGGAAGAADGGDSSGLGLAGAAGGLDPHHDRIAQAASWPRLCHDLRTPLNAILGNAELLLDGSAGPLSGEARACLGDIQSAAARMMRHVQALLELCRARNRPALASYACVDLLALLAAVEPVGEGSVPLRIAPAGARFVVCGDAAWLHLLAGALAELYLGDGCRRGPLHVLVEQAGRGRGGLMRLWWADLHPHQVPALPLALTDAILDLHNGQLSLTQGGFHLYWPACRMF